MKVGESTGTGRGGDVRAVSAAAGRDQRQMIDRREARSKNI